MRLTLVIPSIFAGGAEKVMSVMANYWAAKGWKITLLTFDDGKVPPFYDLDCHVHHICLGIARESPSLLVGIWNNLKCIQVLRVAIADSQPDAVISFIDKNNILTLLATRGLHIPVVVSERIHPAMYSIGGVRGLLRQWIYPKANRVVGVTARALSYFSAQIQSRSYVIPNPVIFINTNQTESAKLITKPSLIAVGRLDSQKGFDLLLQAFALLKVCYPDWTLTILGEGALRTELEALRNQLGLSNRVHLPGRVKNIYEFLKQADIFVMSSRFEGFPNALCEAMACGLPVISTDCPSGPREIIRDGVDGILVQNGNVDALAAAMERLMSNEAERQRLASRATQVMDRFSLEKIMEMWENLLDQVIKEKL
ncbi:MULTISPECIES: glycosyltransferase family 4 protein [unclassified Coleofasciculus]|uniref:glycosyltransferase family 4 protein n=1 Tax=Cyanophyceae TaxID=3028117 RepID=UPI00168A31B3|nr:MULTISPECIES: glycosyltransferase family 4 protein [unclassified Coleofasciculus]MBD1896891.1 glycosyltransferase family 4 protein [Coleofasciculus sp. FACHB-129]MBD2087546.1 glycosyltransferase family 4 protein [Coleofasciculus sp. FACHB-542]